MSYHDDVRKPRGNARMARCCVALVMLLTLGSLVPGSATATATSQFAVQEPDQDVQVPDVTATSVFVYDPESGVTLYAKDPDRQQQVGSIAKVMTALVTIEHVNGDEEVTIQEDDMLDNPTYSNMQLQVGDTLRVDQLLYGLLLPSGGDAAWALARYVGIQLSGSDETQVATAAFMDEMNAHAMELGLENTHFTNPDGADSEEAHSTAREVALMFAEMQDSDLLTEILEQPGYSFTSVGPEARSYTSDTTNQLLNQYGIDGSKTGSTVAAGGCVVLHRDINGGESSVIVSILGSDLEYDENFMQVADERWEDATALIEGMDSEFAWVDPASGEIFPGLGDELAIWDVEMQNPPSIPLPTNGSATPVYQLVLTPGENGIAGQVQFYVDGQTVGDVPVFTQGADQSNLTHNGEGG